MPVTRVTRSKRLKTPFVRAGDNGVLPQAPYNTGRGLRGAEGRWNNTVLKSTRQGGDSGGVKLTGGLSPAEARELMTSGQRGWFMTDVMLLAGLYPRSFGA